MPTTQAHMAGRTRKSTAAHNAQAFATRVKVYERNVLRDRLASGAIWLIFNLRYAVIYTIGFGGRLADLPKTSERPFVSGLVAIYGFLLALSLLLAPTNLFSLALPLMVGLPAAYIIGGYFLVMEYPGGEAIVGTALAVDLLLATGNLFLQALNVLVFPFFLLICVKDWRDIVRLPERGSSARKK